MQNEKPLQEIGAYYGTDKYDSNHSFANKSYLNIYDLYLSDFRKKQD